MVCTPCAWLRFVVHSPVSCLLHLAISHLHLALQGTFLVTWTAPRSLPCSSQANCPPKQALNYSPLWAAFSASPFHSSTHTSCSVSFCYQQPLLQKCFPFSILYFFRWWPYLLLPLLFFQIFLLHDTTVYPSPSDVSFCHGFPEDLFASQSSGFVWVSISLTFWGLRCPSAFPWEPLCSKQISPASHPNH